MLFTSMIYGYVEPANRELFDVTFQVSSMEAWTDTDTLAELTDLCILPAINNIDEIDADAGDPYEECSGCGLCPNDDTKDGDCLEGRYEDVGTVDTGEEDTGEEDTPDMYLTYVGRDPDAQNEGESAVGESYLGQYGSPVLNRVWVQTVNDSSGSYQATLLGQIVVVAHELGHLFCAHHTDGALHATSGGMFPACPDTGPCSDLMCSGDECRESDTDACDAGDTATSPPPQGRLPFFTQCADEAIQSKLYAIDLVSD